MNAVDWPPGQEEEPVVRIGISSCLLGERVRWNGGHTRDRFLTDTLGEYVEWVPVCPEKEVGMGVPREQVRLLGDPEDPKLVGRESGEDWTERMQSYAEKRIDELRENNLHGYILKRGSPTCGMEKIKVLDDRQQPNGEGPGLFARKLMEKLSLLPVEDDGRLNDPVIRENFIERIFAFHRWRRLIDRNPESSDLIEFHTAHKMTLLAHHQEKYRELGRLISSVGNGTFEEIRDEYGRRFMETMAEHADRGGHANVLHHLQGYLKEKIPDDDRQELDREIRKYREGQVPLIVPVTLLKHHFRKNPMDWVMKQTYLNPYPAELQLRNHV